MAEKAQTFTDALSSITQEESHRRNTFNFKSTQFKNQMKGYNLHI